MKRFFVVLRNAGAYFCISAVVVISVINLMAFLYETNASSESAYAAAKTALWMNFAFVPVVAAGNMLFKTDVKRRVNFLGGCGVCGVFASLAWGILVMISGFFAGSIVIPIVLFAASMYGSLAIYCATIYFVHKIRDMYEVREADTNANCGCCNCEMEL